MSQNIKFYNYLNYVSIRKIINKTALHLYILIIKHVILLTTILNAYYYVIII